MYNTIYPTNEENRNKNLIMFVVVVGYLFYLIFLFDCICILLFFSLFCLFSGVGELYWDLGFFYVGDFVCFCFRLFCL